MPTIALSTDILSGFSGETEDDHQQTLALMREIELPTELRVGQGYGKVAWAVRTIWETYIGWFKFASTTELYPDSAEKAARFVMDCNQSGVPLIFLQDVQGFMVGKQAEQSGIIFLDEIDKIAASVYRLGADVSRTGVQRALLKPMEETEVEMKVPHDPIFSFLNYVQRMGVEFTVNSDGVRVKAPSGRPMIGTHICRSQAKARPWATPSIPFG
mgnify:CR=1 FL=1